uniref:Reverse transcriptase domain-containing protein n=1 Tax=Latimeria chalumnae TaxID=7897 RepID=H3AMH6_LATCH
GFTQGFWIHVMGSRTSLRAVNLKLATELSQIVKEKIPQEVSLGRMVGPFADPPYVDFRISPLGLVKKLKGENWLIYHLSFPWGNSQLTTVYAILSNAIAIKKNAGDAKADNKLLPIHPEDFNLLGFKFQGNIYVDKAMPMGCFISFKALKVFSTFFYLGSQQNLPTFGSMIHYLDDFLFMGPAAFRIICASLGVTLAEEKTQGPCTSLNFLSIELVSVAMQSKLPGDKINTLEKLTLYTISAKKLTLQHLQKLIGHLNFACYVLVLGHTFSRRIIAATKGLTNPFHHTRVTKSMRDFQVYSDTSGNGFSIYLNSERCADNWPAGKSRDITFLELFHFFVAGMIRGDCCVLFKTDNQSVVEIINRQSSRSGDIMLLVRPFIMQHLQMNIMFKAKHIAGKVNLIADTLSCSQWEIFHTLILEASPVPTAILQHLW